MTEHTKAAGQNLSYGELLRLTEGHGTSTIYERIAALRAENERLRKLLQECQDELLERCDEADLMPDHTAELIRRLDAALAQPELGMVSKPVGYLFNGGFFWPENLTDDQRKTARPLCDATAAPPAGEGKE